MDGALVHLQQLRVAWAVAFQQNLPPALREYRLREVSPIAESRAVTSVRMPPSHLTGFFERIRTRLVVTLDAVIRLRCPDHLGLDRLMATCSSISVPSNWNCRGFAVAARHHRCHVGRGSRNQEVLLSPHCHRHLSEAPERLGCSDVPRRGSRLAGRCPSSLAGPGPGRASLP